MPFDIDEPNSKPQINVFPSKTIELIASLHMLAERKHHEHDPEWIAHVKSKLTPNSTKTLNLISKTNFPAIDLFDFVLRSEIYDDIYALMRNIKEYNEVDFLYVVFNATISKTEISHVLKDKQTLTAFEEKIPWTHKGCLEFLEYLLYDTRSYIESISKLLIDIYEAAFEEKLLSLQDLYSESIASINKRLLDKDPITLAEEIKGSKFSAKCTFLQYAFIPSYFLHHHNIISRNLSLFILTYNINADSERSIKEAERLSDILKVLSDKTRLEILRQLKTRSTYGKVLASRLKLTTATISRHLDQLKSINLIYEKKQNNVKYFFVNHDEVDKIFEEIRRYLDNK